MNSNIINIKKLIEKYNCNKFFVLDTKQDGLAEKITYNDGDITYSRYCYETFRNNKLEKNSIFLYRQTKRSSKNRKFYFFGGGVIEDIVEVNSNGSVEAKIIDGFKLKEPIYEDDEVLNTIEWTSKVKKDNTWDHFWNQYGINEITREEFLAIVGDSICLVAESLYKERFLSEYTEEDKIISVVKKNIDEFSGNYVDSFTNKIVKKTHKNSNVAKHIDFNKVNKNKKKLGTFGEMLIVKDETEKLNDCGILKEVEHVAITKGDGLGYDVVSYDENGKEILIEVKTTSTNRVDGFYLSPKEIEMSKEDNYKIYRIYNLDMKTGNYDVKIFDNKEIQEMFRFVPISYRVELK